MSKQTMITFPTVLNSERKWLFDYAAKTAEKNPSNSTSSSGPTANNWAVEKGGSYISSSGNWGSKLENDAWKMQFNTKIGNHYWYTSYCGYLKHNSGGVGSIKYSPLYDGIAHKITFNWKKYDHALAENKTKHRFKVNKFGIVHRNGDSAVTKDVKSISGYTNLTKYAASYTTSSGTGTLTFNTDQIQPIGFYVVLETEGGGTGGASGSWVKLWNVNWQSTESKDAIMSPYGTYSSFSAPSKREIWTA